MVTRHFSLVIFLGFWFSEHCWAATCVKNDPCSCTYDDGSGTVDITSLGNTDGTPRLSDHPSTGDPYKYSYNPCKPFTEKDCKDVAVCAILSGAGQSFYLTAGRQDKATFGTEGSDLVITYTGDASSTTKVTLTCDKTVTGEPKWDVYGLQAGGDYKLGMTHKCNCPGACTGAKTGGGGLGVGSILCIILLACVIVYFGFGALFLFFGKKESGVNVIPNHKFWTKLPGQIKDGGRFLVGSVTGKHGEYAEI